jgi:hypothetical protein
MLIGCLSIQFLLLCRFTIFIFSKIEIANIRTIGWVRAQVLLLQTLLFPLGTLISCGVNTPYNYAETDILTDSMKLRALTITPWSWRERYSLLGQVNSTKGAMKIKRNFKSKSEILFLELHGIEFFYICEVSSKR